MAGVWGWGGRRERGKQDTGVFVYLIKGEKKAASGPDSRGHVTSRPACGLTKDGNTQGDSKGGEWGHTVLWAVHHLTSGEPPLSV